MFSNHLCPTFERENKCSTEDNYTSYSIFKVNPYLRGGFSQDRLKIKTKKPMHGYELQSSAKMRCAAACEGVASQIS